MGHPVARQVWWKTFSIGALAETRWAGSSRYKTKEVSDHTVVGNLQINLKLTASFRIFIRIVATVIKIVALPQCIYAPLVFSTLEFIFIAICHWKKIFLQKLVGGREGGKKCCLKIKIIFLYHSFVHQKNQGNHLHRRTSRHLECTDQWNCI